MSFGDDEMYCNRHGAVIMFQCRLDEYSQAEVGALLLVC